MATYYFIYKYNRDKRGGGVKPPSLGVAELGIAEYGDWLVGKTEDPTYIYKISEYNPHPISEDIAKGILYLDDNEIDCNTEDVCEGVDEEHALYVKKAIKFLNKLLVRADISIQVEDLHDVVADLNKRLEILERLVAYFIYANSTGNKIPERYINIQNKRIEKFLNGKVIGTTDLKSDEELLELIDKLDDRSTMIVKILKDYYNL